LNSYDTLLRK